MAKYRKNHIDFFFEVYEKNNIPNPFSGIQLSEKKQKSISAVNKTYSPEIENQLFSVFFIPDYFEVLLDNQKYRTKKIKQFFKGYAIRLDGFKNVDEYLKYRFRSNAKSIKKKVNRLENCFDVTSSMYFGDITKEDYDFYMKSLYDMLVARFEQRNDTSQSLLNWEKFEKLFLSLINKKQASLFVMFENNKPIVISLSHHFEGHLFSAISSYDIDYSKFSPGSIEIYKKLEWCLANNHNLYEMGMGDLTYKREWCDLIYNFEHQIIYPANSIEAMLLAQITFLKASAKELVYKLTYVRYKKFKAKFKKPAFEPYTFEVQEQEFKTTANYPEIDYNSDKYAFLKNCINDFCYTSMDHIKNIKVYALPEESNTYLIKGKSTMQKLLVQEIAPA